MGYSYSYVNKSTGKEFSLYELEKLHRAEFSTYGAFSEWLDHNFTEQCRMIQSPYERTRATVYATGNKWAIENFNATH